MESDEAARTQRLRLLERAQAGDRPAFDELVSPHIGRLRALALRMLGQPDDAQDIVQDALLRAYSKLDGFRGDANVGTWLFTITTRLCLNALRSRKRWDPYLQTELPKRFAAEVHNDPASPIFAPDFIFDAHEHIAFCFTCVARSLPAEQETALLLRDVFEHSNREAANVMGLSESVLRHHLAKARAEMTRHFEGLCAIVSKKGVCHQCSGLRSTMPATKRGREVPSLGTAGEDQDSRYRYRLKVVQQADLQAGTSAGLHALLLRRLDALSGRSTSAGAT